MKHLKKLGFAAVAAMALTAVLGAGSASATVLCKTASNPCPTGSRYGPGTQIDALLGEPELTFENSIQPIDTCAGSTLAVKSTGGGSSTEAVPFVVEEITFSTCKSPALLLVRGEMQLHWASGTNSGVLTARGTEGEAAGCRWHLTEWTTIGTINGGNPATIEINMPNKFPCLWTRMTARYDVGTPQPLYVEGS